MVDDDIHNFQLEGILEHMDISEVFDIPLIQKLTDSFNDFTGMPLAIIDINGNVAVESGWKKICKESCRKETFSEIKCNASNMISEQELKDGQRFKVYQCRNGLMYVSIPIILENSCLGSLYTGQFLFEEQDRESFAKQAKLFGWNQVDNINKPAEVPVLAENDVQKMMTYLSDLTVVIANMGIDKLKRAVLSENLENKIESRTLELKHTNDLLKIEINERKQIADEMERISKEQSIILENIPVGIAFLKNRHFMWLNHYLTELFGYETGELVGASTEICHLSRDAFEKAGDAIYTVLGRGESYRGHWQMKRKDGSLFWCHISGEAVNPEDLSQGSIWMLYDITRRLEAEEYARHQAQIMNQIHDSVISVDLDGFISSWNKGSENLFQYRSEEAIGKQIAELYPVESHEWLQKSVIPNLLQNGNLEIESDLVRKDGTSFNAMISLSIFRDEKEGITGMIGYTMDNSERKKVEMALQERERFLDYLLNAIPIPVFYKDETGRYLGINPAFESFFGDTVENIVGKTVFDIAPRDLAEVYYKKDIEMLESGSSQQYETQVKAKEGALRDVIFNKAVFRNSHGSVKGLIGTVLDVTDRKKIELQIKKSLREKETLLQEVHHRVKNNLAVIVSMLNLQSYRSKDEHIKAVLEESSHRVKSMSLIHETLYQSDDLSVIMLKDYISNLANRLIRVMIRFATRPRLRLDIEDISLDIDQAIPCGLILNELITNAIKYAFPEGNGEISISAHYVGDGEVELVVKDDGIGFSGSIEDSNSFGFSIVTALINNQLEGNLEIKNDNGAAFTIRWPISRIEDM